MNLENCIYCLNSRINQLEKQVNCLCNLLDLTQNPNIIVNYNKPFNIPAKNGTTYIQLKGGVFYKRFNNTWNIIGTLEPLIVDGGDSLKIIKGD